MPWVNWVGWAVTSVVIAFAFEALGGLRPAGSERTATWAPVVYAVNVLFPVSICLLYGLPSAGVIGLVTLALVLGLVRWRTPSAPRVAVAS